MVKINIKGTCEFAVKMGRKMTVDLPGHFNVKLACKKSTIFACYFHVRARLPFLGRLRRGGHAQRGRMVRTKELSRERRCGGGDGG